MADLNTYFSVLALFILFRETIEASIICGVLLQFLNRAKPALKKTVWWGVAAGVGVSIIFGVIFISIYYTAQSNLFKGKNRDWFKGIISWIAAVLITILGFAMLRFLGWEEKWKRRLNAALADRLKKDEEAAAEKAAADAAADKARSSSDTDAPGSPSDEAGMSSHSNEGLAKDAEKPLPSGASKSKGSQGPPPVAPYGHVGNLGRVSSGSAVTPSPSVDATTAAAIGVAAGVVDGDAKKGEVDVEAGKLMSIDEATGEVTELQVDKDGRDMSPATRQENTSIFVLVFTTVVREGIESVVFLGGLGNVKLSAVPLPAFVGIVAGVLVGVFLYYSGKTVKHIKWLVIIMAVIIFFIAAGQVNLGTFALMNAGLFGYCSPWLDERPWYMIPFYDWSHCCGDIDPNGTEPTDEQNRRRFFALMRAIFGYQDKGTPLEVIIYCCYWGLMIIIALFKLWRGTLFDADYKYTREQRRLKKEAALKAKEEAEAAAAAAAAEGAAVAALEEGAGKGFEEDEVVKGEAEVVVPALAAKPGVQVAVEAAAPQQESGQGKNV